MTGWRVLPLLPRVTLLAVAIVLLGRLSAEGATRKAILIGIDLYNPPAAERARIEGVTISHTYPRKDVPNGWKNIRYPDLSGAVADTVLMKGVLESMGFTDIVTLRDQEATADRILAILDRELIREAHPGDVRFVYYSGHGGYARNRATGDQDETIVPADHWRDVPDIRDKELSRILYAAGSKGVIVTMVADSCHSGSLSRGVWNNVGTAKTASGSFEAIEVNDPPDVDRATGRPIDPKDRNVLYISAAQRYEEAMEYPTDEGPHGAFTWALRQALAQGPQQRVDLVYQRTLAYLKAEGRRQTPVLDGAADRRARSFVGEAADDRRGLVVTVNVAAAGGITVRGGPAIGIYPGSELTRLSSAAPPVRIRITKSLTAATSEAVVFEPSGATVSTADQFQLSKYVVPPAAMLRIYIPGPASSSSAAQLAAAIREASARDIELLADRTAKQPTAVISWTEEGWILERNPAVGSPVKLGQSVGAEEILREVPRGSRLLAVMPTSPTLNSRLLTALEGIDIELLKSPRGADYVLDGRLVGQRIEYAWVRPDALLEPARSQPGVPQSDATMPDRSDWVPAGDSPAEIERVAATLIDKASRLGRLRAWLTLLMPPDPGTQAFPYHLVLQDAGTGALVTSGPVKGGSRYKVALSAADFDLQRIDYVVKPRFVYVFAVDHFGKGSLVFPLVGHGNEGNHLPIGPNPGNQNELVNVASRVRDGRHLQPVSPPEVKYDFEVAAPFGVDTYFLLASDEPIDDPDVFEFDGARSRSAERRPSIQSPLSALLSGVGGGRRGLAVSASVPTGWTLERFSLKSEP